MADCKGPESDPTSAGMRLLCMELMEPAFHFLGFIGGVSFGTSDGGVYPFP
jgi:hypothetical protein